jgi:hypothetical protein
MCDTSKGALMTENDHRTRIENILRKMSLAAKGWIVVEPNYGEVRDEVTLQKQADRAENVRTVRLNLSRKDLDDLSPTEIKKRILEATGNG